MTRIKTTDYTDRKMDKKGGGGKGCPVGKNAAKFPLPLF
jgi:hypothetical protein